MNEIQNIDNLTIEILILKQQTAQNIIEIGKRLITVKESLPHGEWGKYLEEKVDFSNVTATRFMRVANEFSNVSTLKDLSQSKIFALLDLPQEEREEFIQNNPVNNMSTRELQQAIKEKKELEEKLKLAEKKAEDEYNAWQDVSRDYAKLEEINKKNNAKSEKLRLEIQSLKDKNKEELVDKEVEIENLKLFAENIKKKLETAKESGDNEEIEKLQAALHYNENSLLDANKKIEELEQQLKEKPIDVITAEPEIIEKIPEEVEKELQEFRGKVKQSGAPDVSMVKFKVQFDELIKLFKELLETIEILPGDEIREKYKAAAKGLINKMLEKI